MIRKIAALLLIGAAALSTTGCTLPGPEQTSLATTPTRARPANKADDLANLVYDAAQMLGERSEGLAKDRPIIVTTIVSVDDLKQSTTFGRLVSELIANRLEQRGYLVRDVRYMGALELRPETGERVLSREASKVSRSINAQAVVAGTYAIGGWKIYLNLRLLKADNAELLSSVDVVIPLNDNTRPLVEGRVADNEWVSLDRYESSLTDVEK